MSDEYGTRRRGWILVWSLATAQLVSWGALYYGFSLFVVPMEADLGWSRAHLNGALSVGLLAGGASHYAVGSWIDRHGGRWLMTAGAALGALMLVAWSQVESIVAFYLIWAALGVSLAMTLYQPVFVVLTRLFPQSYRTKITYVTLVGGFASTVFIPLTQALISLTGWRAALIILAAIVAAVCIPVHALLLRDRSAGARDAGDIPAAAGSPVRRAIRTRAFWGLVVSYVAYYGTFTAMTFHLVPLLTDRGFAPEIVVAALAVIGPAQVAGRFALLAIGRDLRAATIGRIVMPLYPAAILALLLFPASLVALFGFAVLYGTANGIMTIVRGTAVPELLGRDGIGAISGALALPITLAQAISPFAAALVWSAEGGYRPVLWIVVCGGVISVLGFWFATAKR